VLADDLLELLTPPIDAGDREDTTAQ